MMAEYKKIIKCQWNVFEIGVEGWTIPQLYLSPLKLTEW